MNFIFGILFAVKTFVYGAFGIPLPVAVPAVAPGPMMVAEVSTTAATTTSAPKTTVQVQKNPATPAAAAKPKDTPLSVSLFGTSATTSTTIAPTSTEPGIQTKQVGNGSGSSRSSLSATSLSIGAPSLKGITENDTLTFSAEATFSDGTKKDVTGEASWEVLGLIGSMKGHVFTALLDPSMAEFGRAPGAVVATWKDASGKELSAETGVFYVEAYVPKAVETQGQ